jgi:hypothetical protein
MRNPNRIKRILRLIEKIWSSSPDQRFGQLLINLGLIPDNLDSWGYEDADLEKYLEKKSLD